MWSPNHNQFRLFYAFQASGAQSFCQLNLITNPQLDIINRGGHGESTNKERTEIKVEEVKEEYNATGKGRNKSKRNMQ